MIVHRVPKCRKAILGAGIQVGDPYYWWKPWHQARRVSRTHPRPSQVAGRAFLRKLYKLREKLEDAALTFRSSEQPYSDFEDFIEGITSELERLLDERYNAFSNMAEAFPNGCPAMRLAEDDEDRCDKIRTELHRALHDFAEIRWGVVFGDRPDNYELRNEAAQAILTINWDT